MRTDTAAPQNWDPARLRGPEFQAPQAHVAQDASALQGIAVALRSRGARPRPAVRPAGALQACLETTQSAIVSCGTRALVCETGLSERCGTRGELRLQ